MLDVLHSFANFSKKTLVDKPLTLHPLGERVMELPASVTYKEIVNMMIFDPHIEKMKQQHKNFIEISLLFFTLKSIFEPGLTLEPIYSGKTVEDMAKVLNQHYDNVILAKALYLLGFVLGRELTYKYAYMKGNLTILEK